MNVQQTLLESSHNVGESNPIYKSHIQIYSNHSTWKYQKYKVKPSVQLLCSL